MNFAINIVPLRLSLKADSVKKRTVLSVQFA